MNKALVVMVILLGAVLVLTSAGSQNPALPASPLIVARGRLMNQTAPFDATIFTPPHDGVYRLSAYATITKADPSSQTVWEYGFAWTDDAGPENSLNYLLSQPGSVLGQFANDTNGQTDGGIVRTFEAKAGTPITHTMGQNTSDNSAYSLYYTLERLQ